MKGLTENKIVLVKRATRLDDLVARFNTVEQARFYVEHRGADFTEYQREAECYRKALGEAENILGLLGRVQTVDRKFLPNFVFGPNDTVVAVGQDGLVANTLKYLNGQPLIGVNPDSKRWDGQLLPFQSKDLLQIVPEQFAHKRPVKLVTMAKASLNNGQTLYAVNDIFVGPKSHATVRYKLRAGQKEEVQLSSGIIISTGLGSTGWFKSLLTGAGGVASGASLLFNHVASLPKMRAGVTVYPGPLAWDANRLYFTVREPFPSKTTSTTLVFGTIDQEQYLTIASQTAENAGTIATISVAERKGVLVQ
jgi:NAD kinase